MYKMVAISSLKLNKPCKCPHTACHSRLWQVWHEHFIEVEWLSLECDLALHLLRLRSDGLCHLFVYRVSVTRPEAFIHGDSSVSARGKKHTVSHRCHNKKRLFMTFDHVSRLAYWRFYVSRTWGFLLMWQREMKMDRETARREILKQANITEEEEQEEKRTSQINKPR